MEGRRQDQASALMLCSDMGDRLRLPLRHSCKIIQ